jgi:hypothetical protein
VGIEQTSGFQSFRTRDVIKGDGRGFQGAKDEE